MAYKGFYINPLFQHGQKSWRLILQDSDGILPDVITEKSFPDNVKASDMTDYTNLYLDRHLDELEKPRQEIITPTVDAPTGKKIDGTIDRKEGDLRGDIRQR